MTELLPLPSIYQNDAIISQVLGKFVSNLRGYVQGLSQAVESRDYLQAAAICHRLKGTSAGYGYPAIAELADELDQMLQNPEGQSLAIERYVRELEQLDCRVRLCIHN